MGANRRGYTFAGDVGRAEASAGEGDVGGAEAPRHPPGMEIDGWEGEQRREESERVYLRGRRRQSEGVHRGGRRRQSGGTEASAGDGDPGVGQGAEPGGEAPSESESERGGARRGMGARRSFDQAERDVVD